MSTNKILPLDKTVLTEFKIQVADIHRRSKHMVESIAVRVPNSGKFISADATVDQNTGLDLLDITSVVAIHSFSPIVLVLQDLAGGTVTVPCTGLFLVYGAFARVTIRVPVGSTAIRLAYIYA